MGTGTITDFGVPMNETDIDFAISTPSLAAGYYNFVVTTAKAKVSGSGNMSLQLGILPVDSDGETRTPGANLFLTVPVKTPAEILEAAGVETQKSVPGKFHLRRARQYIGAVNEGLLSDHPLFHPETKTWTLSGEEIDDGTAQAARKTVAREVLNFFNDTWQDPSLLVGGSFYAQVSYKEGNRFPNIDRIGSELPEGEEVVL